MNYKSFMEALKGKQHKLDKNKNGKLDAHDFKLLRKEESEQTDESFDFNRAALAKQKLMNLKGKKTRGSRIANLMRAAGLKEEEFDETTLDQLDEVLNKSASASDWIHDFVHSTHPKFEGKSKKERINMALGAYYNTKHKKDGAGVTESKDPEYADGDMSITQLKQIKAHSEWILEMLKPDTDMPEWVQSKITLAADYLSSACDYLHVVLNEGKKYEGLEKEDKPGKFTAGAKSGHPKGVNIDTVEGWKDSKKAVKESGVNYKDFMAHLLEYEVDSNGRYVHKGTYGSAKGAKYGVTDYDKETLDTKDDEGSETPKRGRGRPAGSKSGARGPRIK